MVYKILILKSQMKTYLEEQKDVEQGSMVWTLNNMFHRSLNESQDEIEITIN